MRMKLRYMCVGALMVAGAFPAIAAPPAGFDARVQGLLKVSGLPGMSIAIVENGKTTLAKGYGVKRLGSPEAIGPHTLFPSGSTGKAFTVAALATMVDSGKLRWDDKVADKLPGFQMYNSWVTREMTVRDLLVHHSGLGLGAGDMLLGTQLTRAEMVSRLRHLKPATSFRSTYTYDNFLYIVAGRLIESLSGQSWEEYVSRYVLEPASMLSTTTTDADRIRRADRAQPHARLNGGARGLGDVEPIEDSAGTQSNPGAPAGGLATSAADMSRWISILLANGQLPEGGRLFSAAAAQEMFTPRALMPLDDESIRLPALRPKFNQYALAWVVRDYAGAKVIWHGGVMGGFLAFVALLPEKNVGFSILINAEENAPLYGLMFELLDHYLERPRAQWPERYAAFLRDEAAKASATIKKINHAPARGNRIGPSLPLERYAGDYADPWFGRVSLRMERGKLLLDMTPISGMRGPLQHWQYDTFRVDWAEQSIEPAFVTFVLTAEGAVERIKMKTVSPIADFSFDYHDLDLTPAGQ